MKTISLHDQALKISRQTGLRIAILITIIISTISLLAIYSSYIDAANGTLTGQINDFSFWVQVNDRFQIQRTLSGLIGKNHLAAAVVIDRFGTELGYKGPENFKSIILSTKRLMLIGSKIYFTKKYLLREIGTNDSTSSGQLIATVEIPISYLLMCLSAMTLISWIFIRVIENSFTGLVTEFAKPIKDFAKMAESTQKVTDFDSGLKDFSRYSEFEILGAKIRDMAQRLIAQESKVREAERITDLATLSAQVAHDIRSPVSALRIVSQATREINESTRNLINMSCERIEQIAEDLLSRRRKLEQRDSFLIRSACEEIVAEKVASNPNLAGRLSFVAESSCNSIRAHGIEKDFKRVISNLLNNAIETGVPPGTTSLEIFCDSAIVDVKVTDDGPGIPMEVINSVEAGKAFTTKPHGNGLGLVTAKDTIESWGGCFSIKTSPGKGTCITMRLLID